MGAGRRLLVHRGFSAVCLRGLFTLPGAKSLPASDAAVVNLVSLRGGPGTLGGGEPDAQTSALPEDPKDIN